MIKKSKLIATAVIALTVVITVVTLISDRPANSQAIVLDVTFTDATLYLSEIFKTAVMACQTNHPCVWGPSFLDSKTQYRIETKKFEPGRFLQFQVWYYQIGGEYNIFTVEHLENKKTRLTVNQTISFIVTLPYWPRTERRILEDIQSGLLKWTANPEPSGPPNPQSPSAPGVGGR